MGLGTFDVMQTHCSSSVLSCKCFVVKAMGTLKQAYISLLFLRQAVVHYVAMTGLTTLQDQSAFTTVTKQYII